jgi:hypothetical protein
MENNKLSVLQARSLLWHKGVLSWALKTVQKELYNSYTECKEKIIVWNCSRRLGKSYSLCVIALETCLKKPNSLVKYCCAKQKDAKGIIRPLIRDIIQREDGPCPPELKPEYKTQENAWVFPNGSRIELTGLDGGRAESVRGGSSDLCIIDEAGLVNDLPYIITSIILPTTATTKGKIILASTPPKSPIHPFITRYLNKARIEGNLVTKTIYDNPNIDKEEFDKLVEESGGVDSIDFRREYLCEIIKDDNYAIIPEFDIKLKQKIVKEWPRASFYDSYVAMDVGMKDLTVCLFAWFDFINNKLIIEDEFVINGQKFNTSTLADGIKRKEDLVFTDRITGELIPPYLRISDNNLIVIKDLFDLHGLRFLPTQKDHADAALNKVRILLQNEEIIINPRCTTLITHLEAGIWNKAKTSFDRSADNGHFDAIDSLKYLVRNVQFTKNPYPNGFLNKYTFDTFKPSTTTDRHTHHSEFNKMFNIKPSVHDQKQELVNIFNPKKRLF